jgi:hypothetical protein
MADAEPSLAELIRRALESRLAQVRVSMPGVVTAYDTATRTVTVQPALSDVVFDDDDERVVKEIPPIQNVPVVIPAGARLSLSFRLEPGDTGDLVFATNSISDWQRSGQTAAPGDLRLHPLGSAKFYPGLRHDKNLQPDTDESIGIPGGLRAHFKTSAIEIGAGADFVALAQKVLAELTALKGFIASAAGTEAGAAGLGGMTALSGLLSAWPSPGGVGASNLKADP